MTQNSKAGQQFEAHYASDQVAFLRLIGSALFSGPIERLSLMVGAGMSRNAIGINPGKRLPTWYELSEKIAQQLCPASELQGK